MHTRMHVDIHFSLRHSLYIIAHSKLSLLQQHCMRTVTSYRSHPFRCYTCAYTREITIICNPALSQLPLPRIGSIQLLGLFGLSGEVAPSLFPEQYRRT